MAKITSILKEQQEVSLALAAGIFKDFDHKTRHYVCVVCHRKGCNDVLPHVNSNQHKNAVAWYTIYSKTTNDALLKLVPNVIREAKIQDEIETVDNNVFSYRCKICATKRPFNGLAPLESHLNGSDHAKNKTRNCHASSPQKDDVRGATCVDFSLPLPYTSPGSQQPYANSIFQRSPAQFPSLQDYSTPEVKEAIDSGTVIKRENMGTSHSYFCKVCNIPLTGMKPVIQHLECVKHKKKMTGPSVLLAIPSGPSSNGLQGQNFATPYAIGVNAQDALRSGIVEERDGSYFCKVCNLPMTGPMPLNQHADSEKHRKKADLIASMSKVQIQQESQPCQDTSNKTQSSVKSAGPSSPTFQGQVVSDFGAPYSLGVNAKEALQSGTVEDRKGSYYCTVCRLPMTGPMPLNQHADSEKHKRKVELNTSMLKLQPRQEIQALQIPSVKTPPVPAASVAEDSGRIDPQGPDNSDNNSDNNSDEDICNDDAETDGLVQYQCQAFQSSSYETPSKAAKNFTNGIVFAKDDEIDGAITALENLDPLDDKDSSDFCQFILSELKNLDNDLYNKAKRKIQLVLFEFQDLQDQRKGKSDHYPSHSSSPSAFLQTHHVLITPLCAKSLLSPTDFTQDTGAVSPLKD